jgi:hypothetical protein
LARAPCVDQSMLTYRRAGVGGVRKLAKDSPRRPVGGDVDVASVVQDVAGLGQQVLGWDGGRCVDTASSESAAVAAGRS